MSKSFTKLYNRIIVGTAAFLLGLTIMVGGMVLFSPRGQAATWWEGDIDRTAFTGAGTSASPYQITSGAKLAYLSELVNAGNATYNAAGKYYILTNDIELNDTSNWTNWATNRPTNIWTPIGTASQTFKANFNGDNHTVLGVYMNGDRGMYSGFFGYSAGRIENVGLEKGYIKGQNSTGTATTYTGGIVAYSTGIVNGCWNTCTIVGGNGSNGTNGTGGAGGAGVGKEVGTQGPGNAGSNGISGTSAAHTTTGGIAAYAIAIYNSYNKGAVTGGNGGNGGAGGGGGGGSGCAIATSSYTSSSGGRGGDGNWTSGGAGGYGSAASYNPPATATQSGGKGGNGGDGGNGGNSYTAGIVAEGTAYNCFNDGTITSGNGGSGGSGGGGGGGGGAKASSSSYWGGASGTAGSSGSAGHSYNGGAVGKGSAYNCYSTKNTTTGAAGARANATSGGSGGSGNNTNNAGGTGGTAAAGAVGNGYTGGVVGNSTTTQYSYFQKVTGINASLNVIGGGTAATNSNDVNAQGVITGSGKLAISLNNWVGTATPPTGSNITYKRWVGDPFPAHVANYTITFDSTGGSAIPSVSFPNDAASMSSYKPATNPTRANYDFVAWYKEAALTNVFDFSTATTPLTHITLYAKWAPHKYNMTFNMNGYGTAPMAIQHTYGTATPIVGLLPQNIPDSEEFVGWSLSNGGAIITTIPASTVNPQLWANWKKLVYPIVYVMNGQGIAPDAPTEHNINEATSLDGVEPQDISPEQTFVGWSLSRGGEIVTSIPANTINPHLWANWGYQVFLNRNGGSGGTENINVIYYADMPSITVPTRTGYTFQGYFDTLAQTGGTQYYTEAGISAQEWNKQNSAQLWARWAAREYTVTLDGNGGSGGTPSTIVKFNSVLQPINIPSLDGYFFKGYFDTMLDTGGKQYYSAAGESVGTWDKPNNATLWARWSTSGEYILSFNTNGGSIINAVYFSTDEETLTDFRPADPTRVGYVFSGWYRTSDLTIRFDFRDPIPYSNFTIYADWTPRTSMITLNNNGFTTTFNYTFGEPYPEPPPSDLTLKDHTFNGWFYLTNQIDAANWGRFLDELSSNVTIYASFTPYPAITLISSGSTIGTIVIPPNTDLNELIPEDPQRLGYSFNGWYREATLTNPYYFEYENAPTKNINVYASWKAKRYTIIYDFNGGSHPSATMATAEWGLSFAFAVPTQLHYHFTGWFTLGGKQLTSNTGNGNGSWNTDSDDGTTTIVIRAHWTPAEYVMRFNTDGGNTIPQVSFGYGELIPTSLIPLNPSKEFAVFIGWFNAKGEIVDFNKLTMPADGITIHAKWAADLSSLYSLVQNFEEYMNLSDFNFDEQLYQDFVDAMVNAVQILEADEPTIEQVVTAYNNLSNAATALENTPPPPPPAPAKSDNAWIFIVIGIMLLFGGGGVAVWLLVIKKKKLQ